MDTINTALKYFILFNSYLKHKNILTQEEIQSFQDSIRINKEILKQNKKTLQFYLTK